MEALQRDNDRLHTFLGVTDDWRWEVDARLNISVPGERFAAMRGVSPESLVGQAGGAAQTGLLKYSRDWRDSGAIRERHEPFRNTEFTTVNAAGEPPRRIRVRHAYHGCAGAIFRLPVCWARHHCRERSSSEGPRCERRFP
jgi:hypothetical protein